MPIDIQKDDLQTALKKLKARENTLRQIEALAGLGSWEIDLKTKKSIWSEQSYKLYGYKYGEVEPSLDIFLNHLLPEDLPKAQETLAKVMQSKQVETLECRLQLDDGTIKNILLTGQVLYDDKGNPLKLIGTTQDITEFKKLQKHTQELAELLEHSSNEVYVIDAKELKYLYVNDGACNATQYSKEELLNMSVYDINPLLTPLKVQELQKRALDGNTNNILHTSEHKRKDGTSYYVQSYIHTVTYNDKDAYVIFDTDITEIIDLQLKHERQAKILEHIHDSVIAVDLEGKILSFNRGSKKLLYYEESEILGHSIEKVYSKNNEKNPKQLLEELLEKEEISFEAYLVKKDKQEVICDISLSLLRDDDCRIIGAIGYSQDITDKKIVQMQLQEQRDKLNYLAHHDMLTNLPNRILFYDRLEQAIAYAQRNNKLFALLFLDLDQFKQINDSLGHDAGDIVLQEVAKRLTKTLRLEDTLSRLGGDEFTIILRDIKDKSDVITVCKKIIEVIKEPIIIESNALHISSSIGISIYKEDAVEAKELIKFADTAMYKAKEEGRDNFQFYSKDMTVRAFERVIVENALRSGIENDEFIVYFQPQYNASEDRLIGMEALVRWQHPDMGLVPPGKFIPVAEESGLIIELDRIVMKKAMKQFALWYEKGLNPGILALNLAMKQLAEKDFLEVLATTMKELDFKPEWLELEITEGDIMTNPEVSIAKLKKIHEAGIELAIDDFGTGYSSLSYLRRLPLDKLKIDQSFVKDILESDDAEAIVQAIISLGTSLNMRLIAEGVEVVEQKNFLVEHGCKNVQGYFYSKPIPPQEVEKLLLKS